MIAEILATDMKWWNDVQSVLLVIAAVGAFGKLIIDAIYGGRKLNQIEQSQNRIESKQMDNQSVNTVKLDNIHEATNGGLAALRKELESARLEISELKKHIALGILLVAFSTNVSAQSTKLDPDLAWHNNQRAADVISYLTVSASLGIDLYNSLNHSEKKRALIRMGIKDGSIIGISELVKKIVHRTRPDESDNKSFYSEHTALSFSCSGKCLYFGFSTAYLRTAANKHYLTDVLVGGLVGAGINAASDKWIQ